MTNQMNEMYEEKEFVYFENQRPEMLRYIPKNALKVLDVGCSNGSFGQCLKLEHSAEVWGIEPNKRAAEIANQKLDKVICNGFTNDLDLPKHSFDCVIFNDVLEHLVDPYDALLHAKQLLRPQGLVVASIPNVRYFDNIWNLIIHKDWQYSDWGVLDKTHLRFFTQKSIVSTFNALGYEIELIEGINTLDKVHPHQVRKFKFLNRLLLNKIEDMLYLQFAVVAHPRS